MESEMKSLNDKLLNPKQVAAELGYKVRTIYALRQRGILKPVKGLPSTGNLRPRLRFWKSDIMKAKQGK